MGDSITLKQFGYGLKGIWGDLRITNNGITIEDVSANTSEGPTEKASVRINGKAAIQRSSGANKKHIDFDGSIEFRDFNLGEVTELEGLLQISGLYEMQTGLQRGEANFSADKVRVKGKLLTKAGTRVGYDHKQQSWVSKSLAASCYEGKLTGKFKLKPTSSGLEYTVETGFGDIDLRKFLQDRGNNQPPALISAEGGEKGNYSSGKMSGSLNVKGQIGESFPRIGRCRLAIKDMEVGRMSPLAKVLSVLKLTEPKDFAFEQMLVDSYIENKKLFLEKIDLSGEALAFNGSGWMDLESQNINVTLTARGRRLATAKPSVLQSLTDVLGTAVVRLEVTGNYSDPTVKTTTLPVIRDSLEILGTKAAK
jgi:hypothetical protein